MRIPNRVADEISLSNRWRGAVDFFKNGPTLRTRLRPSSNRTNPTFSPKHLRWKALGLKHWSGLEHAKNTREAAVFHRLGRSRQHCATAPIGSPRSLAVGRRHEGLPR